MRPFARREEKAKKTDLTFVSCGEADRILRQNYVLATSIAGARQLTDRSPQMANGWIPCAHMQQRHHEYD